MASARAVNALAYTVGQDVVFGEGQFAPHSEPGRRVLAHELAHTVQQRDATMPSLDKLEVSSPSDFHERQAEEIADSVMQPPDRGRPMTVKRTRVPRQNAPLVICASRDFSA